MATRILLGIYGIAEASGLLRSNLFRRFFGIAYFAYKGLLEDSFAALIRMHPELFRGGDVLDAGANIGYTASLFAEAVDAGRKVHAFEPEPRNFQDLERVAKRHRGQGTIIPMRAAVGSEKGTISLCVNAKNPGDHRVLTVEFEGPSLGMGRVEAPLLTLSEYVAELKPPPPVVFVKIDVQGFELEVCRGLEELLERNPGMTIALEYMPEAMNDLGYSPRQLLDWLRGYNFQIHVLKADGHLQAVNEEVPLGKRGYADLVCRRTAIA